MYLIDGHNLIGTNLLGFGLGDERDEDKLVQKLVGFSNGSGRKILVVFDSGLPGGRYTHTSLVTAVFASRPGIADDQMRREIEAARDPTRWKVVSNDREVCQAAERRGMQTMGSHEFARLLLTPGAGSALRKGARHKPPQDDDPGSRERPVMSPRELEEFQRLFQQPRPPRKRG